MKGKREADNNFNFKSEKLDELRSRVDAAFDEHGDEAWEQIKGIFTHPKRLLVAALAAVLLVGVITVGGYLLKIRAPELPNRDGDTQDPGQTDVDLDYGDGVRPRVSGERKSKDFYTVLVLGRDTGGGGNTDTMLLASYDVTNQKATVMSIPRDTMVNVSWSVKKVNTLYAADVNSGGNGIDGLMDGLKDILGFQIDCYAVVDLNAFVQLVDAIGGVDYNVPIDMNYYDPTQDLYISIPAGQQHLDGEEALKVVRFRSGYATADIGRIGTQQDFLMSVASQMLTLGNIPNLPTFIDIFVNNVDTNLSAENIAFFARQFLLCKSEDIHFYTLPGNYGDSVKGLSYVSINIEEWLQMVNDCLNPYDQDVTEANVNILVHSYTTGFYSTTGYIAGGKDSFYDNTGASG